MKRFVPIVLALLVGISGCSRPETLPVYSTLKDFSLLNQENQTVTRKSMEGSVWVANFIFTHCPGPCSRMSQTMSKVAKELKGVNGVRFVSFSVDPERDTPAVMADYAKNYSADDRWLFLTGDIETLHRLKRSDFLLGDVDGSLNHSTRFVLLDRDLQVRGFYATADEGVTAQLVEDAKRLASRS